jgi:hypothetical protein
LYDVKISPAGDTLTMTPSSIPVGYVTIPTKGLRGVVFGKQGFLKVCRDESDRVPLPAGEWKLVTYTIDRTGHAEKAPKPAADSGSLLDVLSKAIAASRPTEPTSRPRMTLVSAAGTRNSPAVTVKEGETVAFPFGPPYDPVVKVDYQSGSGQVSLGMSLIGSGGEVCTDLSVDGRRPSDPEFTITAPDGAKVESGKFKYG